LPIEANLLDLLGLDELTAVVQQLDLRDLVRVAQTCKRFRYGEGAQDTAELPTKSPVVTALREHAFPGGYSIPRTRPIGCSDSWVAYLARAARQRACRESPPIVPMAGESLFVDEAGRLLSCGQGIATGYGEPDPAQIHLAPTPVAAIPGVRVRSMAGGAFICVALGWNGRVYSWGLNDDGQLGHGDRLARPLPTRVEGFERVCSLSALDLYCLAATQSGVVYAWGYPCVRGAKAETRPTILDRFEGVRVRRVRATGQVFFTIGEDGELFSWGIGNHFWSLLGHGGMQDQPSPKRLEALRGVRVSSVSVGSEHALALAEDGLVYAWGENRKRAVLGNPNVEWEPLPKLIEALRGMRAGSIAAAECRSYAVADTGELWAWGIDCEGAIPLGHDERINCPLPKPIDSLRGVKVDAVAAGCRHTLARADDGSVYAWGDSVAAELGALGLGRLARGETVPTPRRVPALRVACGL
jgi:alpha-tubulin suppressor-like RCC1 family protein